MLKLGARRWNKVRQNVPSFKPSFANIHFLGSKDEEGYDEGVNFEEYNFSALNLSGASFRYGRLDRANFRGANLSGADFNHSSLVGADFTGAILADSDLSDVNLTDAVLNGADLLNADLYDSIIVRTKLVNVNLTNAHFGHTVVVDVDLTSVMGLSCIRHGGPSNIGFDVLTRNIGMLPESFLQGVGIPESLLASFRSMRSEPEVFASCFISYSTKDRVFAERLYNDLQLRGVRCWLAEKDLAVGARIRAALDDAIREHEKVLLIISKNSVASSWVEKEVETALEHERREGRTVLLPIRLDDTVMKVDSGWAADLRRSRNIGQFKGWKNGSQYGAALEHLIQHLRKSRGIA